jgi:hypothetical protein
LWDPTFETSPATFRGARFTTSRYFFLLTRMERASLPKSTGTHTSVSECAHVFDSENGPDTDVDLVEVRGGDEGFDGRRIHVPLFAEARSIASNSVSLKRQPSASRLVLA